MTQPPTQIIVAPTPIAISLSDVERIYEFFGVSPHTLKQWNRERGFPICWSGESSGRKGVVVIHQAKQWFDRAGIYAPLFSRRAAVRRRRRSLPNETTRGREPRVANNKENR